jgi:hypothetical protein
MGVDLDLLPVDHLNNGWGYSHTVLPLNRDRCLWDLIAAIPATPLGVASIKSPRGGRVDSGKYQGERTYGKLTEDAYGEPYKMVRAGDLAPVLKEHQPGPAAAFIAACDPDRWIVLDWH